MQKKSPPGKGSKKSSRNKLSLKQLWVIILVSIIIMAFILFSVFVPARKKPASKTSNSSSSNMPVFRKDGNLTIVPSVSQSPVYLEIEIADDETERMRGLMDRISLPDNAGMLFIFEDEEPRSFWMKNTFISLDIIFINSNKEIVSIQKYTQPKTTFAVPSDKPAKYVLEVNAGFSDEHGLSPGDKLEFGY